jgi:hypothetical protein
MTAIRGVGLKRRSPEPEFGFTYPLRFLARLIPALSVQALLHRIINGLPRLDLYRTSSPRYRHVLFRDPITTRVFNERIAGKVLLSHCVGSEARSET